MKRIAVVSLVIGLLGAPLPAQAQQWAPQPPLLTQEAADCALGMIKLMAAEVRGADLIEVTQETRQLWHVHLANNYPYLVPEAQAWFANACATLDAAIKVTPQLDPMIRQRQRQIWASSVQPFLQFLQPVLLAAQQLRAAQQNAASAATPNRDPVAELQRQREIANSLSAHNNRMNVLNSDLMRAMSGRR